MSAVEVPVRDPARGRWRFRDWPLRAKIAALLVVVSLLPLSVSALLDIRRARRRVLSTTNELLAARADQLVGELDTFNRGYQRSVERVSRVPRMVDFALASPQEVDRQRSAIRQILEVWPASDPSIRGLGILDASGTVMVATEEPLVGMNLSHRSHVRAVSRGSAVVSDIYIGEERIGYPPTIAYLSPINGPDGKVVAAAALWVRAAAMWDVAKASNELAGPRSFAVLFDHRGIRIAHTYSDEIVFHPGGALEPDVVAALVREGRFGPRTRQLLQDVRAFPEQFDRARSDAPDTGIFRGFAPVNRQWNYGVARRFETVPWTVFYMIPEDSLKPDIDAVTRQKLVEAAAIILLALAAGSIFTAIFLKPIGSLSKATASLARGDLSARVRMGHADELGRLGMAFDTMAARIESQATDLRSAHDELEERVQERTADLVQARDRLTTEIAERSRAEDRYRRFFEQNVAGACIVKPDGTIVDCNPAFARIFGFDSVAEALAANAVTFYSDPEERSTLIRQFQGGGEMRGVVLERRRRDGEPVWLVMDAVAEVGPDGALREIRAYMHDITEQRKVEAQLLRAQRMEAVGQLAGGIAHDFNNLLGVMGSYAELALRDVGADHKAVRRLREIRLAVDRAAALTRQLLTFSRRQPAETRICDLNRIVTELEPMLRRLLGEDVRLIVAPDPEPRCVEADPGQLEQVVTNLVVNARDAMPDGGRIFVEISRAVLDGGYLKTHPEARAGENVVIAVTDSGEGMDAETQARIFDPFFTTKEPGKGTGLGLSVVYGIVKRFGGHVGVYSEPKRGTVFKVYFPRVSGSETPPAVLTASPELATGTESILLIEDDVGLRGVIGEMLREAGYRVWQTADAEAALAAIEDAGGAVDLLLTDVVLPGRSGPRSAVEIRERLPRVRVLYMSGYTDRAVEGFETLPAASRFLQKPFREEELLRRVRDVLDEDGA
jgi:PAS domain S-box-containing protein